MLRQWLLSILVVSLVIPFGTSAHAIDTFSIDLTVTQRAEELTPIIEKALKGEFESARVGESSTWILLYDVELTPYAFFVPLYNQAEELVGYSVVSDINGINVVLATCEGSGASDYASYVIEASNECSRGDVIVYVFPDAFFVGSANTFDKINLSGNRIEVTNMSEYDAETTYLLAENANEIYTEPQRAITYVYGSLDNWDYGGFVPVSVTGGVYYGGYQGWLTDEGVSSFWADRACGLTAAANALHYMSQNVSGKSDLYTKSGITKTQFSAFQKQLYDYCLSPAIWGIPNWSTLKSKVEEWADYRNVSLSGVEDNSTWNTTNVRNYIATGLNAERPVLLQTWNSPIENLSWHWVTVTRIYLDGTVKILTSNWAGKAEYDFATWCNSSSLYKSVLYFN